MIVRCFCFYSHVSGIIRILLVCAFVAGFFVSLVLTVVAIPAVRPFKIEDVTRAIGAKHVRTDGLSSLRCSLCGVMWIFEVLSGSLRCFTRVWRVAAGLVYASQLYLSSLVY